MSRKFKDISSIKLLILLSLLPLGICYNVLSDSSFRLRYFHKGTRLLEDFATDSSGLFSVIPLKKLHPIRAVVDPILGLIGNTVNSVMSKTNPYFAQWEKVQFRLFSDGSNNATFWKLNPENDWSIKNAKFRTARPIKILIHGFQADGSTEFPEKTKNIYLQYSKYNVIVVDWGPLAYSPINFSRWMFTYPSAVSNLLIVSHRVADLIVSLHRNGVIKTPSEVHLIGFSLGAHISGQAGLFIEHRLGSKIGRITGLDAAGPLMETSKMEFRLDPTDAHFVDVIHSSQLGMYSPIGHADFYPNGGRIQNQCYDGFNALQNLKRAITDTRTLCSHMYSYELFNWSIQNWELIGCSCSSWAKFKRYCRYKCSAEAIVGEYCSPKARGTFFLETQLPKDFYL